MLGLKKLVLTPFFMESAGLDICENWNIDASIVFHKLPEQDKVSWIITCYGKHGYGVDALQHFF